MSKLPNQATATPKKQQEQMLRAQCLSEAIRALPPSHHVSQVLLAAKAFEDYITNGKAK